MKLTILYLQGEYDKHKWQCMLLAPSLLTKERKTFLQDYKITDYKINKPEQGIK